MEDEEKIIMVEEKKAMLSDEEKSMVEGEKMDGLEIEIVTEGINHAVNLAWKFYCNKKCPFPVQNIEAKLEIIIIS